MNDRIPVSLVLYRDGRVEIEQHEWRELGIEDEHPGEVIVEIKPGD